MEGRDATLLGVYEEEMVTLPVGWVFCYKQMFLSPKVGQDISHTTMTSSQTNMFIDWIGRVASF